jgi:hypothetical protein
VHCGKAGVIFKGWPSGCKPWRERLCGLSDPGFRLEKNRIAPIGASFDIANLPTTMEVDGYECFAQ